MDLHDSQHDYKRRAQFPLDYEDGDAVECTAAACSMCMLICVFIVTVVITVPLIALNNESSPVVTTPFPTGWPTSQVESSSRGQPVAGTLGEILSRGRLRCGVSVMPARAELNSQTGEFEGFTADLCRAVAAAVFGRDRIKLEIVVVQAATRFQMLESGDVDILASWDTHTMERDVAERTTGRGFSFSVPYYYDGLSFGGLPEHTSCIDSGRQDCLGINVCVNKGTTYETVLETQFAGSITVPCSSVAEMYQTFIDGTCNVMSGSMFDLGENFIRNAGYQGPYLLGSSLHSRDPLALVTRDGDPHWSDFANWIVESFLNAEERGYTQFNSLESFEKSNLFGEQFSEMYVNVLYTVGNYAELYDRHFAVLSPRTEINMLNEGATGLMYALPFGKTTTTGPKPLSNSTIEQIKDRGRLRCGVSRRAIFAIFNASSEDWSGYDVDFCRALSAALFDGDANRVDFFDLPATIRFVELNNGNVDVLSRLTTVTYSRDVLEAATSSAFSFARPNFYDGLSFGGIPPYVDCVDRLDFTSEVCLEVKTCVNKGTTFYTIIQNLLPSRAIVEKESGEGVVQGLQNGDCNAIAGGVVDVSRTNVRDVGGYDGEYAQGNNRFSKDPLALVTRQADQQWTTFVFWVVMALYHADEQGLSNERYADMPLNNLFGPEYRFSLQSVVKAVGSYGDIYNRTFQKEVARNGPNLLNIYPFGPQHFSLPGLA